MTEVDRFFISAMIIGCTTFNTVMLLAVYWALKLYLDDIWKQNEKTKRKVKKIVKRRQSIKHCKFTEGNQGVQQRT